LDRRPPRAPSNAAVSDNDVSVSMSTTRSSTRLDSDSDDGSDLDEEDNAYENVNEADDDDEDDEEFRCHTEAPDLSVRARGSLGEYLKGLDWKFEAVTDQTKIREPYRKHTGRHGLKPGMADRFNDPLECLAECGVLLLLFWQGLLPTAMTIIIPISSLVTVGIDIVTRFGRTLLPKKCIGSLALC